jgi:hypothetical protein
MRATKLNDTAGEFQVVSLLTLNLADLSQKTAKSLKVRYVKIVHQQYHLM